MRVIGIFDWEKLSIEKVFESFRNNFKEYFDGSILGVLTHDMEVLKSSNYQRLMQEFANYFGTVSLEVHFNPIDENDPEIGWDAYVNYSVRAKGKKTCIIALNTKKILTVNKKKVIKFLRGVSEQGDIGYGFSFEQKDNGDGVYYSMGISTANSTESQREEDERWFSERIRLNGIEKNRHLKGYFKNIFEVNIINKYHLKTVNNFIENADELIKLGSMNYLWMPNIKNIEQIKKRIRGENLII